MLAGFGAHPHLLDLPPPRAPRPLSYPLTTADLVRLQDALAALLSPVDRADGVEWPTAAVDAVRRAVGTDEECKGHVYFVRGADPRPIILHSDYGPELVDVYSASDAPFDESSRRIQERGLEVAHPFMVMPRREFLESAIYRDLFCPHGIGGYVSLLVSGAPGPGGPGAAVRLSITSPALMDEARLERAAALARVLHPAFRAGAHTWRHLGAAAGGGAALAGLLDAIDGAVAVCDRAGRVRHANAALGALLAAQAPAEAARVREAVAGLARAAAARLFRPARAAGGPDVAGVLGGAAGTVRAGGHAFALHAALAPEGALGEPAVLVTVRAGRAAPDPRPAGAGAATAGVRADDAADDRRLRARSGLTPQELAVARLMAERRTDPEIGTVLGISPHTARTHAERVRRKLGVTRRADVAAALRAVA